MGSETPRARSRKVNIMSQFHCSCGFAIDDAESFADHLGWVFDPYDDIGTDGNAHAEVASGNLSGHLCTCGFATVDTAEFNDHLLIVVIPPDAIGIDGDRHAPTETATPIKCYVRRAVDD
jgi:hypothetical protein